MAGGPVFPYSIDYPASRVFPGVHVGGTNSRSEIGIQVEASLGGDATMHLRVASELERLRRYVDHRQRRTVPLDLNCDY